MEDMPRNDRSITKKRIPNSQSSQQQEQLDEINEAIKSAENTLQAFLTETAPFHQKEGRR